jgi:hypothetical protein
MLSGKRTLSAMFWAVVLGYLAVTGCSVAAQQNVTGSGSGQLTPTSSQKIAVSC